MTLTRGARTTGAVLCAVLGVIAAGWIVRDLRAVGDPPDLLRYWAGYTDALPKALPATSQGDLVLLVVQVLTAFAALRSRVAASALVATGVVTFALRLPGVWTIGASWMDGRYGDELRTRALIGTFVTLAAALALIVTGSAGRRQPTDGYEPRPTRPGRGAAVTAFLVLGASGAVLIAWEVRQFLTFPSRLYPGWFIGSGTVRVELTGAPPGWSGVALGLICLVVASTALFRAVHARPLGMIAAGFLLVSGAFGIARAEHHQLLDRFGDLGTEYQLVVLTSFLLALTGATALLALARRGLEEADGRDQGHDGYGYPPQGPGYGYPPQGPGYGYPSPDEPGYGRPGTGQPGQGPGYGYPQGGQPGGGFGPPPPASPPPGW
ncbi:hypothetical protein [Streptomyces sp. B1I3]|uniref:hypothetical protein n=1 Tax=Streptomyces sp. B1I3 TaxID=3042264 RepID=UPI0027809962|nr:hypothetical protein [Streptomyces sp. B1I3]MDQ0794175.1 hypothetical protein [Streptomyces sp. B1I3]